jgi:hypothetical protein
MSTSVQQNLAKFRESRVTCRDIIQRYKQCQQNNNSSDMSNNHPCKNCGLLQNICTGRILCPPLSAAAETNRPGSQEQLVECLENFMTTLKKDLHSQRNFK